MMKKKELILDFTSLLDVIMILLFVVISNMNQASISVNEETKTALSEAQSQIEDFSNQLEDMRMEYDSLQNEYDYLKITTGYDANDMTVYEATIERVAKVILICNTSKNAITGNYEVSVDIYLSENVSGESSFVESVIIEHDLDLTQDERREFNAEQILNMTRVLSNVLRDVDESMIWISIQYAYDDENFSNSDLRIIRESINNLERSFAKSCYTDEIRIY